MGRRSRGVISHKTSLTRYAYPLNLRKGIAVVGQGESYEEALADVTSAIKFTLDSSSESEIFDDELPAMEVFVAEIEAA